MLDKFKSFYRTSAPVPPPEGRTEEEQSRLYKKLYWQTFLAATLGYSLYYVCRTSLNVMKKPIIDQGILDATQLGMVGSALLFAYAAGKFVNGFLADHSNIRRFMATGLVVSTLMNLLMGLLGFSHSLIPTGVLLISFIIMWAVNGWSQSMGAAPAIISLSRWLPLSKRGRYYGFFSASHNFGEGLSFIFVGAVVSYFGWQWGFIGSSVAGALGVLLICKWMQDTPESRGLPPIEALAHEQKEQGSDHSVSHIQKRVLRTPAVWILAAASACMYISRYAVNGWGILFLQEAKGFSDAQAISVISINTILGVIGTVFSGWFAEKVFKGNLNYPAFIFGVLNTVSLVLFVYGGNSYWVNILSMSLFGIAIGVLICFIGGLMAVTLVPRKATGAALGVMGMVSYIAAGLQDVASGWLIDTHTTVGAAGEKIYDFAPAALFWIGASVISFLLPVLNWWRKPAEF